MNQGVNAMTDARSILRFLFECFCVLFATRGMFYIAPDGTVAISFGNLIVSCICGVCLWYLGMYIWGVEVTITDARRIIKMLFGWLCVVFFVIKPSFYVAPVENTPFEVLAFNFGIVSLIVYSLCALIMWYVGTYIGRKVIDFFGGVSNNDPTIQN